MTEKNKYHFGVIDENIDGVEIPEFDALIDELEALLAKYNVTFVTRDEDGIERLRLIAQDVENCGDLRGALVNGLLEHIDENIPWLIAARREWWRLVEKMRYERNKLSIARASETIMNEEQRKLDNGIVIRGQRYKLVPMTSEEVREKWPRP